MSFDVNVIARPAVDAEQTVQLPQCPIKLRNLCGNQLWGKWNGLRHMLRTDKHPIQWILHRREGGGRPEHLYKDPNKEV